MPVRDGACAMLTVHDYPPALHDAVHAGNPGDVDFYRSACAGAGNVLELGCGTGRIASMLSQAGHAVVGIDLNRDALAVARGNGLTVVLADMRGFHLARRFDRVVVPYNGLYCLLDEDDLLRCLERVREHLAPGGLLVFDGYAMDDWHAERDQTEVDFDPVDPVTTVVVGGRRFDVFENTRWDPLHQRVDAVYRHVPADGGEPIVVRLPQRYLLAAELPGLLARAGLRVAALHGDFDGSPFASGSPLMVVRAESA